MSGRGYLRRSGAVCSLTARAGDALVIACGTSPGADATVELYTANQRSELLAAATGLAVHVLAQTPTPGVPPPAVKIPPARARL